MDPFSIATGSLALVGTITKVSIGLTGFVREVRDARSDVDGVAAELNSLKTILELIIDDVEAASNPMPPLLKTRIEAILSSCSQAVNEIEVCVGRHKGSRVQKGMRWATIGKGEMAKLQSTLEANKATLSLALDMIAITTLQDVKHTTEEIQTTTDNIYQDTGDIKDDTARILQAIVELQARLPPDENPRFNMLQRYLDELSTYAESVIDDIDHKTVPDEYLHESPYEETPIWADRTNMSSTTFVEDENESQAIRHEEPPSLDYLHIHDNISAEHPPQIPRSSERRGARDRRSSPQDGSDFDYGKIASTIGREKGSRQKQVRVLTPDPATHEDTILREEGGHPKIVLKPSPGFVGYSGGQLPKAPDYQTPDYQTPDYHTPDNSWQGGLGSFDPTLGDFQGPFSAEYSQYAPTPDPLGGPSKGAPGECYCPQARRLERIVGLPNHFIPGEESLTISPYNRVRQWSAAYVPNALIDCALIISGTIPLLGEGQAGNLLDYLFSQCDIAEVDNMSTFSAETIVFNIWRRPISPASKDDFFKGRYHELNFFFAMTAVVRFLDKFPHPLIPTQCVQIPRPPRFSLSNEITLKRRVEAAEKTLSLVPLSVFGITNIILRIVTQCIRCMKGCYIGLTERQLLEFFSDRIFEGNKGSAHMEFFTFIINNANLFHSFMYEIPKTYRADVPEWAWHNR